MPGFGSIIRIGYGAMALEGCCGGIEGASGKNDSLAPAGITKGTTLV